MSVRAQVAAHANDLVEYATRKAFALAGAAPARLIAQKPISQVIASGAPFTPIIGWSEIVDTASSFDPVTGTFTVPADGFYQVSAALLTLGVSANNNVFLAVLLNGAPQLQGVTQVPPLGGTAANLGVAVNGLVRASKNDLITLGFTQFSGSPITTFAAGVDNYFTIAQLP